MDDLEPLRRRLTALIDEHRDLDDAIARVLDTAPFDQIRVQRLKKRKLQLKDMIIKPAPAGHHGMSRPATALPRKRARL